MTTEDKLGRDAWKLEGPFDNTVANKILDPDPSNPRKRYASSQSNAIISTIPKQPSSPPIPK